MNYYWLPVGVVLLALGPVSAQTPEAVTILYLKQLQAPGSGFRPSKADTQPSLRATSSALRALKYFGGAANDRAACATFVARCFDKNTGGFRDRPGEGQPDVATTAVGLMAVVELKMPSADYAGPALAFLSKNARSFEEIRIAAAGLEAIGKLPDEAADWRKLLAEMRNADGTYGKGAALPRATGGAVACQLRLGEKVADPSAILKAIRAGQRADGGYGHADKKESDLETTYRVMRTFVMLKEQPAVAKLKEFVASCRNDDGGYGVTPGATSTVSGTYFASILLHWSSANKEPKRDGR